MRFSAALLFLISSSVFAQVESVVVDHQVKYPFLGSSVAINTKNPSNVVVSANLNRVYVSLDSGRTWTKKVIHTDLGLIGKSELFADRKGNFYIVGMATDPQSKWEPGNVSGGLFTYVSEDNGNTWEKAGMIDFTDEYEVPAFNSKINVINGDIFTTYIQYGGDGVGNKLPNIYFTMSKNGGGKWSKPVSVLHNAPENPELTHFAVQPTPGPSGQVYVTWVNEGKLMLDRTYNDGKTWLRNDLDIVNVASNGFYPVEGFKGVPGLPVSAMDLSSSTFSGSIYLTWSEYDALSQASDIFFVRSANRGDSWSRQGRINIKDDGKVHFAPAISVDPATGLVYVAYLKQVSPGESDLYLSWSLDGGSSFKQAKINNTPINTRSESDFYNIIGLNAFQGMVCPSWINYDGDKSRIEISCLNYKDLGMN